MTATGLLTYKVQRGARNRERHVVWALVTLFAERTQFLAKLRAFEKKQLRTKLTHVANMSRDQVFHPDWIPWPVREFPEQIMTVPLARRWRHRT